MSQTKAQLLDGKSATIQFTGGSVSAPAVSFTGDTNTGIFFPAADTIAFSEGGVEAMRIDSSGNVGIGTSSPTAKLDVTGTAAISGAVTLSGGTANGVAYLNGSKVLTTGSALTFDGTNFGVGTNSPAQKLQVVSASGGTTARFSNTNTGNFIDFYETNTSTRLGYIGTTDGTNWTIHNDKNGYLSFDLNNTEQARLTTTGLGIGTSSPNYSLTSYKGGAVANYLQVASGATGAGSGNGLLLGVDASGNSVINAQGGGINLYTYVAGLLRTTIDSSGNLGLGVTPSAWAFSGSQALQVKNASFVGYLNRAYMSANLYFNSSGSPLYIASDFATQYVQINGENRWYTAPSGTAGNAISFTQAMTLDASGRLMLGRTNLSANAGIFEVDGNGPGATVYTAKFSNSNTGSNIYNVVTWGQGQSGTAAGYIGTGGSAVGNASFQNNFVIGTQNSSPLVFNTGDAERARIDSSGNLLVGTTDGSTGNKLAINGSMAFINGASIPQVNYYSSASTIEFVNRNSGGSKTFSWYYQASGAGSPATLSTSGVWTNASDARGKENIADIHYGLDTVMALQPRQYDVKSDGSHAVGFVAQEVLPVVPELVHVTRRTENDEFYGLDYGSMTAVLVKAIQEQQALINDLRARVAALESNP